MQIDTIRRLMPVKGIGLKTKAFARFIQNPVKSVRHRTAIHNIKRRPELGGLIDETTGHGFLPPALHSGIDDIVAFCLKVLEERRDHPELWPVPERKRENYPIPLLQPKEHKEAPPIFDFVLSDQVLQIASDYLGQIPVVQNIQVWWTPQNQKLSGSQFYHRDTLSWTERQAKFFVNITDVDDESGPFTFLPANISDKIVRKFGYPPDRVPDEIVFQTASPGDQIAVTGKPGSGCVVDSSRCFHYGSRSRGKERLVLVFNFRPFLSPDGSIAAQQVSREFADHLMADPVRRLAYPVTTRH